MKQFAIIGLFVLGTLEVAFPCIAVLLSDSLFPQFETRFEALRLSAQQQVFVEQALSFMTIGREIVSFFGLATIILGILLLVADRRRKADASLSLCTGRPVGPMFPYQTLLAGRQ